MFGSATEPVSHRAADPVVLVTRRGTISVATYLADGIFPYVGLQVVVAGKRSLAPLALVRKLVLLVMPPDVFPTDVSESLP